MFEFLDENGNFKTNPEYTEILKLDRMLNDAHIPHTCEKLFDGYQVCYPVKSNDSRVCDAIEHFGSYGREENLLEIMGLLTNEEIENDSVVGYLSADDVFNRIKKHYSEVIIT